MSGSELTDLTQAGSKEDFQVRGGDPGEVETIIKIALRRTSRIDGAISGGKGKDIIRGLDVQE